MSIVYIYIYSYIFGVVDLVVEWYGSRCVDVGVAKAYILFSFFLFPISYPLDSEMPME